MLIEEVTIGGAVTDICCELSVQCTDADMGLVQVAKPFCNGSE